MNRGEGCGNAIPQLAKRCVPRVPTTGTNLAKQRFPTDLLEAQNATEIVSGGNAHFWWLAHYIAAPPDCLDVVLASRCVGELLRSLQMKTSMIFISGSSMPP